MSVQIVMAMARLSSGLRLLCEEGCLIVGNAAVLPLYVYFVSFES